MNKIVALLAVWDGDEPPLAPPLGLDPPPPEDPLGTDGVKVAWALDKQEVAAAEGLDGGVATTVAFPEKSQDVGCLFVLRK